MTETQTPEPPAFLLRVGDQLHVPSITDDCDVRCPACGSTDAMSTWADDGEANDADWFDCETTRGGCGANGALVRVAVPTVTINGRPVPGASAFFARVVFEEEVPGAILRALPAGTVEGDRRSFDPPVPVWDREDLDSGPLHLLGSSVGGRTVTLRADGTDDVGEVERRVFRDLSADLALVERVDPPAGSREILVVEYDVTGLEEAEIDCLAMEAEVQAERSKGDGFADSAGHPSVPVRARREERPAADLTDEERACLVEFASEYGRDLDPGGDPVEAILRRALAKVVAASRLSNDWSD